MSQLKKPIKADAILWDFDGTLANSATKNIAITKQILARVAPRNQGDLSAAIQGHGLSLKEIHTLIDIWCKARDPAEKQFLLRSPREALALVKEEQAGLLTLQKVWQLLSFFKKRLDAPFQDLDSDAIAQLRSCLTQIKSQMYTIEQTLAKEEQ